LKITGDVFAIRRVGTTGHEIREPRQTVRKGDAAMSQTAIPLIREDGSGIAVGTAIKRWPD
jgi:hypothetical protein